MAAGSALSFLFIEVAGIAVHRQHHIAFAIGENCWILGSQVIQELLAVFHCLLCWFGLFCCNCAEGSEDCSIDSSSIPDAFAIHSLNVFCLCFSNRLCIIVLCRLDLGSILGFDVGER